MARAFTPSEARVLRARQLADRRRHEADLIAQMLSEPLHMWPSLAGLVPHPIDADPGMPVSVAELLSRDEDR